MPLHPAVATSSRSRHVTRSRWFSHSSPTTPTPDSGWRVTRQPVQRWPSSSITPLCTNQHGETTLGGMRYAGTSQPGSEIFES